MSGFWIDDEDPEAPWTLARIYADLASKTEIAADLNITVHRMNRWLNRRERIKPPEPLCRVGNTDIYSKEEWRGWFARWIEKRPKWQEGSKPNGHGKNFLIAGTVDRQYRPYVNLHPNPDRKGWPKRKPVEPVEPVEVPPE